MSDAISLDYYGTAGVHKRYNKMNLMKTKSLLLFTLITLLVGIGVVVVSNANRPSVGTIEPQSVPVKSPATKLLSARGKTANFQYPDTLHQTKADSLSSGDIEKFSFVNPSIPPWNLAVQIRKLPSGLLTDDGSYNLRRVHPEQYHEQKQMVNNQSIIIMTDQSGGYAKVAFLVHSGLVAEISLSCGSSADLASLDTALATVINTWHWT